MKRIIVFSFLLVLVLLIISGCSPKNNPNDSQGYTKQVININASNNYTNIVLQTIKIKDLLTPLLPGNIVVEWSNMQVGTDYRDAAVAGHLDFLALSAAEAITAVENGLPLLLLSNQVVGYVEIYSTKDTIRSLSDLSETSKITVSGKSTTPHFVFALRCKELFDDAMIFDDCLVSVPNADVIGLMQTSNDYDAFIMSFPTCYKIPDDVNYHRIDDFAQIALNYNAGNYTFTTESFARDNPLFIEAFRKACEQAVELLTNEVDEMAVLLADLYGVDADTTAEVIRQCPPNLKMSGYDDIANLMYEMGILSKPPKKFSEFPNYNDIPKE